MTFFVWIFFIFIDKKHQTITPEYRIDDGEGIIDVRESKLFDVIIIGGGGSWNNRVKIVGKAVDSFFQSQARTLYLYLIVFSLILMLDFSALFKHFYMHFLAYFTTQ